MGWSKGKGLGANLDGEQNFIRVAHKIDQKGMGFEDRDDQWTCHENQFNSLLKSLDNSANASEEESKEKNNDDNDEEVVHRGFGFAPNEKLEKKNKKPKSVKETLSGKSLEEMSKNSKARVHYRKFTRGKDISRYSEKDLANIFGKKTFNDAIQVKPTGDDLQNGIADEQNDLNYGVQTIETGTTISDYFKKKKDSKSKRSHEEEVEPITDVPEEFEDRESDKKRRKKDKKSKQNSIITEEETPTAVPQEKEKKKKKKNKREKQESDEFNEKPTLEQNGDCELSEKKKKKNKKIIETNMIETIDESVTVDNVDDTIESKKKKKKKNTDISNETASTAEVNSTVSKSYPNFIETILSALVNVNNSGTSSSTALTVVPNTNDGDTDSTCSDHVYDEHPTIESYEINQFHAEIFRFVDLEGFSNANLSDISGYGVGKNIDLKITEKTKDRTRINDLWDDALINKYGKNVIQAKKKKRYSIKALNKRKLFTGL